MRHVLMVLTTAILTACTAAPEDGAPGPSAPAPQPTVASVVAPAPTSTPEPWRPNVTAEPRVPTPPPGPSSNPYIGELRRATPVINLLSPGRLEIVDGCVVVIMNGRISTAVFPPGVTTQQRDGEVVAIRFEGKTLRIGRDTGIPGGGLDPASPLVRPVPARCPPGLFGVGG